MTPAPLHFQWEWHLTSSPDALWPMVSDTNRFDRDIGANALERREEEAPTANARRLLRVKIFGRPLEWEENPYEWVEPFQYRTVRRYTRGFLKESHSALDLYPEESGTHLVYRLTITPAAPLIRWAAALQLRLNSGRIYSKVFRMYDQQAQQHHAPVLVPAGEVTFVPGGEARLKDLMARLQAEGVTPQLTARLTGFIATADDLALTHIRPYVLADAWNIPRPAVLDMCLIATRVGLLNLQWDVLCPSCRGAKLSTPTLGGLVPEVHCDTCNIAFNVSFERSVELTFRVNPAVREVEAGEFCIAGPQTTPHVAIQQLLNGGETRKVQPQLAPGRYRVRTLTLVGGQYVVVADGGAAQITLKVGHAWPDEEPTLAPNAIIHFENTTSDEQLVLFERFTWSDQAVTAAEVTTMQLFRDLFSREALRPGDQISVGSLTIAFTDLRGSTNLYRNIGDAPAFGLVMGHFDVLKTAIADEGGAIVKTIGDAVMAVFPRPDLAVRAMRRAQQTLAQPGQFTAPLQLKVGIHTGACIAVTLNERLDYFGSTVNLAARLEGQSSGDDLVVSDAVYKDPAVQHTLRELGLETDPFATSLKGFGGESFMLWRLRSAPPAQAELGYTPGTLLVPTQGESTHELLL